MNIIAIELKLILLYTSTPKIVPCVEYPKQILSLYLVPRQCLLQQHMKELNVAVAGTGIKITRIMGLAGALVVKLDLTQVQIIILIKTEKIVLIPRKWILRLKP